jgi:NADH-quinone oxidoreductase subunit E
VNSTDQDASQAGETAAAREVLGAIDPGASLVTVLIEVQDRLGYLPAHVMQEVARHMGLPEVSVYSVASFYNQFRFSHPGRRRIQVCMGTACHVKRGQVVLDSFERRLEIREGGVTGDEEYGLERVNCVGCCTLAPVAVIDEEVVGGMSPTKVDGILLAHQMERKGGG